MARKTKTFNAKHGRDAGKQFLITEMSAFAAERWATRALGAMARSKEAVPPDVASQGMAALAFFGIKSLLTTPTEEAEVLLDAMLGCVQIIPDPSKPHIARPVDEEDVEEIQTLAQLREEVLELHTGFSIAGLIQTLKSGHPAQEADSQNMSTSPEPSE